MKNNTNITICFSTPKKKYDGWASKLVRWWTKSKISHAFLAFNLNIAGQIVRFALSAEAKGFVFIPWERWVNENYIFVECKPTGADLTDSLLWLIKTYLNTDYDYMAAGLTGIRDRLKWVWKWFGKLLRLKLANKAKVMCSESVVRTLQHAKYKYLENVDPETTDAQVLMIKTLAAEQEMEVLQNSL